MDGGTGFEPVVATLCRRMCWATPPTPVGTLGEIRTHTGWFLRPVSLPLEYESMWAVLSINHTQVLEVRFFRRSHEPTLLVHPPGLEPGLFGFRDRRVSDYTTNDQVENRGFEPLTLALQRLCASVAPIPHGTP